MHSAPTPAPVTRVRGAKADTQAPRIPPPLTAADSAQAPLPRDREFTISRDPVDTPAVQPGETRGPEPGPPATSRPASPPSAGGAETARAVAAQLAEVIAQRGGGDIEIALSPEELGRVRLGLSGAEGAMTVTVTAERPETLELMRRHIEVLAQELRDMGFAKLSFSFGQGDRQPHPGGGHSPDEPSAASSIPEDGPTGSAPSPGGPGLDLRL